MTTSSCPPESTTSQQQVTVGNARLLDIAPVFNLIQEGSAHGSFNNLYLLPRYQAGLGIQLFCVLLLGKLRLPSGSWRRADLHVIHHDGRFVGFALLRHLSAGGKDQEIFMCAVDPQYRGQGFGRHLLQTVLAKMEDESTVEAECLPRAVQMKRLLRGMGFVPTRPVKASNPNNISEKFLLTFGSKVVVRNTSALQVQSVP
ncbi:MAG: GNAT family N-acetyltransferase [Rhodocyclales bacterium]|nr:GNAT family N-acetyltransferase [Rhodocyclales bacterium]